MNVQPVADVCTCTVHNTHKRQTSMRPVGFEPAISASDGSQTYVLGLAATGLQDEIKICRLQSLADSLKGTFERQDGLCSVIYTTL